jgi:hypothetical protein
MVKERGIRMRGNKRAVCLLLAFLLALGCLGMAGCKEPEPQSRYLGDLVVENIPGQWEIVENSESKTAITYQIDDDTQLFVSFDDQNIYVQGWLNDFQGSDVLPGQHKRVEVLEEVETEYVTATHVLITMEDDYKYRYRDGYLFECGSGVGYLCLFKTPESRYEVDGEEFMKILNSARKYSWRLSDQE